MNFRHSSIDEYRILCNIIEMLTQIGMLLPGAEWDDLYHALYDYVANERDACALRAAKTKAENQRRRNAAAAVRSSE